MADALTAYTRAEVAEMLAVAPGRIRALERFGVVRRGVRRGDSPAFDVAEVERLRWALGELERGAKVRALGRAPRGGDRG
jgi:hypothetical protein